MTTTTVTRCDFCNAAQVPSEKERWGTLMVGPYSKGNQTVTAIPRDVCPVCIARMRGAA